MQAVIKENDLQDFLQQEWILNHDSSLTDGQLEEGMEVGSLTDEQLEEGMEVGKDVNNEASVNVEDQCGGQDV
ncbi:hypothetical protein HDU89_004503 [Geranomyces variabilis]|nr:hypothetical protein HDU89_004503 [Geranomyces variabilis]